jgi:hypothetical protein
MGNDGAEGEERLVYVGAFFPSYILRRRLLASRQIYQTLILALSEAYFTRVDVLKRRDRSFDSIVICMTA